MASRSPVKGEGVEAYRNAWAEISGKLSGGASWSGHEHNNAWLNLGAGEFEDVSAATGLAFDADGRGVVRVDWDGDGDLDLWVRSRSAPGLRYLENQSNPNAITLRLRALSGSKTHCADAIGARVRIISNQRSTIHGVRAGEGYLSQSTGRIVRALVPNEAIQNVQVTWPNGTFQEFPVAKGTGLDFTILQGSETLRVNQADRESTDMLPGVAYPGYPPRRVVLRSPLPFPKSWLKSQASHTGGRLVAISNGSIPSGLDMTELQSTCQSLGLSLTLLGSEDSAWSFPEQATALGVDQQAAWKVLRRHIVPVGESDFCTWLVDKNGDAQVLYLDGLILSEVAVDAKRFVEQKCRGNLRGSGQGRWFHGAPRGIQFLSRELRAAGSVLWADSYAE
ncbi:MAG: hypothetical protein GY930_13760 [bacterium]|nr:hypothetical protein [bacterium]